jgi:hypothetical protein
LIGPSLGDGVNRARGYDFEAHTGRVNLGGTV